MALLALAITGCNDADNARRSRQTAAWASVPEEADADSSQKQDAADVPGELEVVQPIDAGQPLDRCRPGPGATGSPTTILEAKRLINSLPRPLTVPCFLESLDRPLLMNLTASAFSAQPAVGYRSPRVFLFKGDLILSVVPDGVGLPLLELSELVTPTRSIKAEIEFPLTEELTDEYLAGHIARGTGTVCRLCHADETLYEGSFEGAFTSDALKPRTQENVLLEDLQLEYALCDSTTEAERCALLTSVFAHGEVLRHEFPEEMPTFF